MNSYLGDLPQLVEGGQTAVGAEGRGERYRWVYGLLGLRVKAHKDGTLELAWGTGAGRLAPGEPRPVEPPARDAPVGAGWASSTVSDPWELLDAVPTE